MRSFVKKTKESKPTLVVFQHAGKNDAVDVRNLAQQVQQQYGDTIYVERVDCSYNGEYKEHYKLSEYPTWIIFREGQELMRESGNKTLAQLTDMVNRTLEPRS